MKEEILQMLINSDHKEGWDTHIIESIQDDFCRGFIQGAYANGVVLRSDIVEDILVWENRLITFGATVISFFNNIDDIKKGKAVRSTLEDYIESASIVVGKNRTKETIIKKLGELPDSYEKVRMIKFSERLI